MDKIKISDMSILADISKQLKLPLTSIVDGITQEQADMIESLSIPEDSVEVLRNFHNLKQLKILGRKTDSKLENITIENLPKLESLEILGTKETRIINLRNLPNTYYVNISGNTSLQEIVGLEDMEVLMKLIAVENKSLERMFDIKSLADKINIEIKLDISMLHLLAKEYPDLSEISNNPNMRQSIQWLEQVDGHWFKLGYEEGISIESKADEILSQIIDDSMSDTEKICAINTWLTENVRYDVGVNSERDEVLKGNNILSRVGITRNAKANTSYNALVNQRSVCEGYANGMKYLLNKAGIEAETVPCKIWNPNEQRRTNFVKRSEANHSIIRFKTKDGWFYSDPTWESEQPDRRKYFFKTKNEMSNIHGLADKEMIIDSPEIRPQEYSNERLSEILTNQRDGIKKSNKAVQSTQQVQQEEYQEEPEVKTRIDNNPESFRRAMRFDVPISVQQEIIERHKAVERDFEREMQENPDKKKIESIEHGVR